MFHVVLHYGIISVSSLDTAQPCLLFRQFAIFDEIMRDFSNLYFEIFKKCYYNFAQHALQLVQKLLKPVLSISWPTVLFSAEKETIWCIFGCYSVIHCL